MLRTKIKATVVAIIAAFAMLVGGLSVAAPAQADTGTTVAFRYISGGLPNSTTIWFQRVNGTSGNIGLNGVRADVKTVCPNSSGHRLYWYDPRGNYYELNDGQCTRVSLKGTYRFGVA